MYIHLSLRMQIYMKIQILSSLFQLHYDEAIGC